MTSVITPHILKIVFGEKRLNIYNTYVVDIYFDWVVFGSLAEKFIENTAGPVYLEKKTVNCNKTEMGCVNLKFEYFTKV